MENAFWGMALASGLHALEEYVYPGGFLRWLRILFPRSTPGALGAIIINAAFFLLVLSPLFSPARATPVVSLSIAWLLLANGILHVVGTFWTRRYSPGTVTSVICYFPAALYALATIPEHWRMGTREVVESLILGGIWQGVPLSLMLFRRYRA